MPSSKTAPIAVFDSGVGGLSILQALRQRLPAESFLYFADTKNVPYGEKEEGWIQERSLQLSEALIAQGAKAVVVACNTATAAAIATLRKRYPLMPFIGIEPAIKPAALHTTTGHVGVLATKRTLSSQKFHATAQELKPGVQLHVRAATGLAWAIEKGDGAEIETLLASHLQALQPFGNAPGQVDTLVLGCTHYSFVKEQIQRRVGLDVHIVDNGDAVARHTQSQLAKLALLNDSSAGGALVLDASDEIDALQRFAARTLG